MKLIIATHGQAGAGLVNTLSMFVEQIDKVEIFCLDNRGQNYFKQELEDYLQKNKQEQIIAFTDILGGSPFQTCLQLKANLNLNLEVISGVNFPMLLDTYLHLNDDFMDVIARAITSGQEGITNPQLNNNNNVDDE
ncbi:MAG: PTS sugar transporter subunit IIA [Mycoplasmatales bacterium]